MVHTPFCWAVDLLLEEGDAVRIAREVPPPA